MAAALQDAALGSFPPPNGAVEFVGRPPGLTEAVVAFTAHHIVAADVDPDRARKRLAQEDLAAPMRAPFLAWLGEELGAEVGVVDVVLVAPPRSDMKPTLELVERKDLVEDPRLARSRLYREELRPFTDVDERILIVVGRGLAGRWELGLEVSPEHRGQGIGRQVIAQAPSLVPAGERLFAQVSPGNAASLRAFLAAGYTPIGGEVLFLKPPA
ncbi:MAG TPA: GNAT family N-acetyltransferase [Actinomycetota bacterium]